MCDLVRNNDLLIGTGMSEMKFAITVWSIVLFLFAVWFIFYYLYTTECKNVWWTWSCDAYVRQAIFVVHMISESKYYR